MPMDFPDVKSLQRAAKIHDFRDIAENESEDDYRNALADHVSKRDFIESEEIRNKVGWNKWNDEQKKNMLRRQGLNIV